MTTWYKCKNCLHNIADYSEGYRRKPPYYLHVNPGADHPDQDCLCGCMDAEAQTGKYECEWCHFRSNIERDIENHIKEMHASILKERTQEEIWKQIKGYDEKKEKLEYKKKENEQKIRFKEEDENKLQKIKYIREEFTKSGGDRLSNREILEICNVEWRSRKGDKVLLKKLIEHGYLEKKGFFAKEEITTKGKSIYDYVDLTMGYFMVIHGTPTELMKRHGFTTGEINKVGHLYKILMKDAVSE